MADRIFLLPDNIANQIAAGEVIQRPGSAVKELLENAVDSGATQIKLFIADAGKKEVYGRPVGMALLKDGSLLVADDSGNTIWRVMADRSR